MQGLPATSLPQGIGNILAGLLGGGQATGGSAQGGLPGLFAALLGGQTQGQGQGLGLGLGLGGQGILGNESLSPTDLAALLVSLKDAPGAELPNDLFSQLGEGDMQVNLQAISIHLQQVSVSFQQSGIDLSNLKSGGDLAKAFVQMGMHPAEAAVKATQIETMLQLVRQNLGLETDDDTPGNLLAMIAASTTSLTPLVQQQVTVDVTQVDIQAASVVVHKAGAAAFKALQGQDGPSFARDLARGLLETPTPEIPQTALPETPLPDGTPDLTLPTVDTSKVATSLQAQLTASGEALLDDDDQTDDSDDLAAAIPTAGLPSAHHAKSHTSESSTPLNPVVAPVPVADVVGTPQGLEVARLLDNDDGSSSLERKVTASQLREAASSQSEAGNVQLPSQASAQAQASTEANAKPHTTFAEKLAHATRADVTHQTVVQVKELAGQGGGVVRMILNPPELGEIRIEMVIRADRVEGKISATDNAVVELLARDVHSLKQGLADAGLKLGDQGLSLMLNQNGSHNMSQQGGQQGHQHPQGHPQQTAQWLDEASDDEATSPENWVAADKLVDVRI